MQAVLRDQPFYGNSGGVTFSGGECTMQPEFLLETLALCRKAGLHTAVDTCGMMSENVLRELMQLADLFLYDIKAITSQIHQAGTGVNNAQILHNYQKLMEKGCRVWVRVPVIGGFNASESEMGKIAAFLKENGGAEQIELMPYHRLGIGKYAQIGKCALDESRYMVSHMQMEQYFYQFRSNGLPVQGSERTEN
jgi:glycyl-radical enzyme activating protein